MRAPKSGGQRTPCGEAGSRFTSWKSLIGEGIGTSIADFQDEQLSYVDMRRSLLRNPTSGPVLGVIAGVGLVVAVFLPWYSPTIAEPFQPQTASGWDVSTLAKMALVLGVVVVLSSLVLAADSRGMVPLDAGFAAALGAVLLAASVVAGGLVVYRLLVLPDPSDFLRREIGLWIGVVAAAAGTVAGLSQLAARG